jgi:hypothetical protein
MSTFQPNKFQPIWRYIQKDITILSLVIGSSRKSEILFIFLIFVPLLVSFVRQHGQHICSTWQKLLHLFPHAGQQPAGAQQLLTFSSQLDSSSQKLLNSSLQSWQRLSNHLDSSCSSYKQQTTWHLLSMQQSTPGSNMEWKS